jgi:hypothetical protein
MRFAIGVVAWCSWLMVAALGCGGGGGTCGGTKACGGDVVGTWKVTSSCQTAEITPFPLSCDASPTALETVTSAGTLTFGADLTYTWIGTQTGRAAQTYPDACLVMNGQTITCERLNQLLGANVMSPSAVCNQGHAGCTCTTELPGQTTNEAGSYTTTAAGLLTETPTGGSPFDFDYCATGGGLSMSPRLSSIVTVADTVSGSITYAKQ